MKKTKILVPAIAVLALGLAASTTATVAWFKTNAASITSQVADTSNVVAVNGVTVSDTFTITASFADPSAVRLTDDQGDTYMWDGSNNYKVSDPGTAMQAVSVTLTVAYTGDNTALTDSDIKTMWEALVDSKSTFQIKCEDATDYTSNVAPTNGNSPLAIKTAAEAVSGNYGLKFANSASDYDNVGAQNITFNKSEIKSSAFSSKSVSYTLTTLAYVGIWGIDNFEQKAADTYVMKVTPNIA